MWLGRGVDHPSPSSVEVKERVELYLYFSSGVSWPVLGWILHLLLLIIKSEPRYPSRYPDYVASWTIEELVFDSRQEQATFIFLFSTALRPVQPPHHWDWGALSLDGKATCARSWPSLSTQCPAQTMTVFNYITFPPHVFSVQCLIRYRDTRAHHLRYAKEANQNKLPAVYKAPVHTLPPSVTWQRVLGSVMTFRTNFALPSSRLTIRATPFPN